MSPGDLKAGLQALHTIPSFLAFQDLINWSSSDVHVEPVVYMGEQAIMSWYPLAACFACSQESSVSLSALHAALQGIERGREKGRSESGCVWVTQQAQPHMCLCLRQPRIALTHPTDRDYGTFCPGQASAALLTHVDMFVWEIG